MEGMSKHSKGGSVSRAAVVEVDIPNNNEGNLDSSDYVDELLNNP
jgi:hypothetical protein